MDIMDRGHGFYPAVGRIPGGADYPVAVDEEFPPLPAVGDFHVGVIDTGLVLDNAGQPHPWFGDHASYLQEEADQLSVGVSDLEEPGYLADADGHGTFVTGLILSEAPTARVIMAGALDREGGPRNEPLGARDDRRVADALRRLAGDDQIQVINLSFAGGEFVDEETAINLGQALRELDYEKVVVVAAAGNDSSDKKVWPAAFDNVIAVGALDQRRLMPSGAMPTRAAFSNYGNWVTAYASGVQLLGPFVRFDETGGDEHGVRPPQHFRGWARWSGTSFAAATVSGRIAQWAIEHGTSAPEARKELFSTARQISAHDADRWFKGSSDAHVFL
jgi:subtilisin family serine protease